MCDPLSIISGVSAAATFIGGKQQARNATIASNQAAQLEYQQIAEKQKQVNQQSAVDQAERRKQGMLEQAKIYTIASEAGALGLSSDRVLGDSFMQQGVDISSMEKNRTNAIKQTGWEARQSQGAANSRNTDIAGKAPTLVGTGLQIAGDIYTGTERAKAKAKAKVD